MKIFFTILTVAAYICLGVDGLPARADYRSVSEAVCCPESAEDDTALAVCRARADALETEIALIDRELLELQGSLEWLQLRVHRMVELNRQVPEHICKSIAYKEKRIAALEASRKEYATALARIRGKIPSAKAAGANCRELYGLLNSLKTSEISEWFDTASLKTTLPILFSSGSAALSKEYEDFFKQFSDFVKQHDVRIVVDGYADVDPIKTKTYPSNFELGATRAANVVHALVRHGVDPSLFKVASTGQYRFPEDRPMSDKKSMERYVRITLLPKS